MKKTATVLVPEVVEETATRVNEEEAVENTEIVEEAQLDDTPIDVATASNPTRQIQGVLDDINQTEACEEVSTP